MEDGWKELLIPKADILMTNKYSKNKVEKLIGNRIFRMDVIDLIKAVDDYYTDEEWEEILDGGGVSLVDRTTRGKKEVMHRFIRQYVRFFILEMFDELQHDNDITLGSGYIKFISNNVIMIDKLNREGISFNIYIRHKVSKVKYLIRYNKSIIDRFIFAKLRYYK